MRIDLINCILDLLQKNSIVALPGLGSLRLERDSARISKNKIYPPTRNIKFSNKIEEVDQFVVYLKEKHGISTDNAEKVLKRFSQRLINQLVNYNEVLLPKIGVLKTTGNKSLKLIKDETAVNFTKNYLPVLSLERIEGRKLSISSETISDKLVLASSTKVADAVVEPVKIAEVEDLSVDLVTTSSITEAPQTILPSNSNQDEGTVVLSAVEMTKSNESNYQFEQSAKEKEGGSSWKILVGILGALLLAFLLFKGCKSNGTGIVDSDTTEETENPKIKGSEEESARDKEHDYDPNKIYKETELAAIPEEVLAKGCIIIVGSFKKEANAASMMKQLEKKGYQNYEALSPNGLKRVGLRFDCVDEDLVNYIQKIRKDIEGKAWYLQPQIHVDY